MNFREFVGAAEVHLRMAGWLMHAHNGVWRKYKRPGEPEACPLPAAIATEMKYNNHFGPVVEQYLTSNGWRRTSSGVSASWPTFTKGDKAKRLPEALLKQMMDDRADMSVYAPRATPSQVVQLLSPKRSVPPPSDYVDDSIGRR